MKRFKAFTLAEVMISMTVIGIVAALVIPTRFTGAQAKGFATLFKTTFTQIQDSLTNATNIKKEPFIYVTADGSYDPALKLDKYMSKNFGAKSIEVWQPAGGNVTLAHTYPTGALSTTLQPEDFYLIRKAYRLKNGAALLFPQATLVVMNERGCSNVTPCIAFIDVNGSKGPNHVTTCTTGTTDINLTTQCTVAEDKINDIFAVDIAKDHILPLTNAVNYVLNK